MKHQCLHIAALCASVFLISGCVQRTPYLDSHFGESVTLLKAQQVLNPEAARNTDPVAGIDGKAGKSAYDEYQKSYRTPEPLPNAFTIGVGGSR
jgi:hypothetical protein